MDSGAKLQLKQLDGTYASKGRGLKQYKVMVAIKNRGAYIENV